MFGAYATVRLSEEQAANTVAAYLAQVSHLPLWAIETGCRSCAARNNPFPPSAGELRTACEKAIQPLREEQAEICKVLDAEVYHPTREGQKLSERCLEVIAAISETNAMEKQKGKIGQKFTRPKQGTSTQLSREVLEKQWARYGGGPRPEPEVEQKRAAE